MQHRHPNQQRKHDLDPKTMIQLEVNGLRAFTHRLKRRLDLKGNVRDNMRKSGGYMWLGAAIVHMVTWACGSFSEYVELSLSCHI